MPDTYPPVTVSSQKDIRIVEFTHSKILDEGNISEIEQVMLKLIGERDQPKLLLDFAAVDHMSSAALGKLINAYHEIKRKNGQLRLANIKPQIFEIFVITKLNKLFKILPTRQEALGSFT